MEELTSMGFMVWGTKLCKRKEHIRKDQWRKDLNGKLLWLEETDDVKVRRKKTWGKKYQGRKDQYRISV